MGFLSIKKVMELTGLSQSRAYEIYRNEKAASFLKEEIKTSKIDGTLHYDENQILRLRKFFEPKKTFSRILSVVNHKGGVGKTTVVTNMGAALAHKGKKVLMVDVDPQSNMTFLFIGKEAKDIPNLYKVHQGLCTFREAITDTSMENLKIIPAVDDIAEFDLVTDSKNLMKNMLVDISDFDYVLIDTPPSLSNITISAMIAATDLLVPVNADIFSVQGVGLIQKTIVIVKEYNPGINILGQVFNKWRKDRIASKMLENSIPTLETRIRNSAEIDNIALGELKTIVEFRPNHIVSRDFFNLIKEVFNVS